MAMTPYVVGQWVRGDKFYGREGLLDEILNGHRNCLWLLGTRRIGKTSILKQLEHLTSARPEHGYFPVFWDFQGAEGPDDLNESLADSLLDSIDRLDEIGIDLDDIEADDLFKSLSRLRRKLRACGRTLLLLGDEVEELVSINEKAPRFLRRLRRALQSAEGIRTVLASKIRLWDLAYEETSTSPFLHGFTPPLFVYGLDDDAARALVRQDLLSVSSRPGFDETTVELIRTRCTNHPYLLQLLGERALDIGDVNQAIEDIATNQMVAHFFAVDFEMLTEAERDIIHVVAHQSSATTGSLQQRLGLEPQPLRASLQRLEHLGFLRREVEGPFTLANYFFKRWYSELPSSGPARRAETSLHPTVDARAPESTVAGSERSLIDRRYELLGKLGRGASGTVYKARDVLLKTTIAIKILKEEQVDGAESMERLRREVLLSRDLSHPNILKVYHMGEDQDLRYVTMQLVEGPDLAKVLKDRAQLPLGQALEISVKLASALDTAHQGRVLHRDLKPSNILMEANGEPRITDFGLARLVGGPGITRQGIFVGTPAYASPEQIQGETLDERSDIYSLGVVIFELMVGRRPFIGDIGTEVLIKHLDEPPPHPCSIRPELPGPLADLILRCLIKDRSQRLGSAARLTTALRSLQHHRPRLHRAHRPH